MVSETSSSSLLSLITMRTMPRLLLLLFCMSVVTMMFIARCGLNMDSQIHNSHHGGLPVSSSGTPGEKALREVMRRKEVEHIRDKSILQEKIKSLETQLTKVQGQVVNLTANLHVAERNLDRYKADSIGNQNFNPRGGRDGAQFLSDGMQKNSNNGPFYNGNPQNVGQNQFYQEDGFRNKQDTRFINGMRNNGDDRFVYPRDGMNPVPRYLAQNDRSPILSPAEDRKPVYYLESNKFSGIVGDRQGQIVRQQDILEDRHVNQFEGDAQRIPNNFRNSAEQRLVVNNQKTGTGGNFGEMNMADRRALGMTDDDDAIRNGVYHAMPGNVRSERSAPEQVEGFESKQNSYQEPNLIDNNNDSNNNDKYVDSEGRSVNGSEPFDYVQYFNERLQLAEILKGQPYKTEYELIPFNRFIFNRIFMVDPGLGKRVVEKPIGSKKKDLNEILYHAVETLNKNRSESNLYTYDDFVEGIYRSDPATGSQYELFFTDRDDTTSKHPLSYVKLSIVRPFAPPMTVAQKVVKTESDWINIILPLSKRLDTFRIFMDQFITVCIKRDKRIYLTVVYFGTEGLKEVKSIMGRVAKTHKFKHMKLVTLNETFARGRGLQIGALNWKGGGDVLLFFCDVDIVFTPDFLERCRLNSEQGQRVYYPIVFSLYNPKIVYSLQDVAMPSFQDQLVLSKDTGFWRDFGYGMTCQYRSDFLKIKGFDEQITGWGGEDVFLYQKFVRSDYFVVRATDPAIFHLWHEKYCDPTLSAEQYRSCIRSKALNEASHAQLGLLAFKDEIDVHRGISERNSLLVKNAVAENRDSALNPNGS